jgi:predicted O-methyltransferase YrrM
MNNDSISKYINDTFIQTDVILEKIIAEIPQKGLPTYSIQPEEGRFLQFITQVCRAKKALEFGTLAGYSSIWIARGLIAGGKLITIEKNTNHAKIAQDNFDKVGLSNQIELRIGEAHHLLASLSAEAPFDFIFIDANKNNYPELIPWSIDHIREGGVLCAHNALRGGKITKSPAPDEGTRIMQEINYQIANDSQLISTIFPSGEGMIIAVKRI